MQYPVTVALPRVLAYVSARYFLSSRAEDIWAWPAAAVNAASYGIVLIIEKIVGVI
jgi:hypothetical protein